MQKIQVQGVHHLTLVGSTRQTAVDFWEGLLGMPLVFEQPNLDRPHENHLYFDPGDGRLLTVFTNEKYADDPTPHPRGIGHLDHIAFTVSKVTQNLVAKRLNERGIEFEMHDRGFMDSVYFRDPNGFQVELACYKFQAPKGVSATQVLTAAHKLRVERGDYNIKDEHLADAIELLMREQNPSLSRERV